MLRPRVKNSLRLGAIVCALSILAQSLPGWAGFVPPKNLQRPGLREGAATRGGDCWSYLPGKPPLLALVPLSTNGLTTAERPTFYWYVTKNTCLAEFELFGDDSETPIYRTRLDVTGDARVVNFTPPADSNYPALQVGKDYRWQITLLNPDDMSPTRYANVWIQRINADPSLVSSLKTAKPIDRYEIYAKAGIWYDALNVLAALRQSQPNDPALAAKWSELLKSDGVKLEPVVDQPLAGK
jgi:hypothetical protein